jgi:ABC-type phosphate transport system auxiliary subunit
MGDSWILMFFVIVVGIPVVVGVLGDVMKRYIRYKERELELMGQHTAEKAAQYAAHTERLEQRVRVLERIATDKGVDLADEIESLRNSPLN